jgi:cobalamin biosynthesis Mg chelatase CobN
VLARVDAYLCELKETQIRDGLHVFGQSPKAGCDATRCSRWRAIRRAMVRARTPAC